MTSATPSTSAASWNSRTRTAPRSPAVTSDGSLIDPRSPRDPHMSTTRTPASAKRANVPPHISDSSSGCANTASTVRIGALEVALLSAAMVILDDAPIDLQVLVDHPRRAEARDRALADAPAIEIEDARQLVRHLLQVLEHDSGHPIVDHF